MGVTVHYSYYDAEVLDVDDHIRGLSIEVHPGCETVHLLFDRLWKEGWGQSVGEN